MTKYVTPRKACEILQVSEKTLRNWELANKISAIRTPSNQRRYDIDSVLGTGHNRITAIYARVSSYKQREELERQVSYLQNLYP